ncbi:MAG: deoxyguanosinetriphosphate triphosphohydrolase [Deltaproteobacteria bacterium]|nr:deoxyguanosinetriphosphate triphosphohydrolase [Candidatus Anaeroferrophillus wilburensis]MBN2889366.1 deoxyguanosinetriphosphate triphosphohydrolase [Deltaproteobacteria bacterium]
MSIRKALEERERHYLSPHAALSSESTGRQRPEPPCNYRMAYQHDRDRIIHSKSFRRLKHKTQVFLSPSGDHYRTRLTHTLEVSQIARTIAKALYLNEDLTEAIALGHDLGHTPFGHAGEAVLDQLHPGGFRHFFQSLRVVEVLEKEGKGLNLTNEVRDGIVKHSKGKGSILSADPNCTANTLEGQIVRLADIIAYVNHDIDDAIRAQVITREEIPRFCRQILGESHSARINTMVNDIIDTSSREHGSQLLISSAVLEAIVTLRDFLYDRVYDSPAVHGDFIKAKRLLEDLYHFFIDNPTVFQEQYHHAYLESASLEQNVCDFVAGMTDRYAFSLYEEIFLPQPWLIK